MDVASGTPVLGSFYSSTLLSIVPPELVFRRRGRVPPINWWAICQSSLRDSCSVDGVVFPSSRFPPMRHARIRSALFTGFARIEVARNERCLKAKLKAR